MTCTRKFIIHRHIAIRSFISILIWEHVVYLIFLWMTDNMTYLKFWFCIVFSHVIWFDIHHIVCVWYVIYVSGDISGLQIITSVNINRYMWNVQIFTTLQGFNCPIFGGKRFAEVTPKGGRVSSIFLLPSDVFWCPPYSMGLRYHHNFRGPLRLTNYNFHTHILHCITFYYWYLSYWQILKCVMCIFKWFWKVWNIVFWVGRLLQKSPKKLEDFPPYTFSYVIHFDVPSILRVRLPWVEVHSAICETYSV